MLARACTMAVGICLLAASMALAGPKLDVPTEVVDRVKAAVPEGWTVSADGDILTVRRDRPVKRYNVINMPLLPGKELREREMAEHAWKGPYEIKFRFGPRLSRQEIDRLRAENDRRAKVIEGHIKGLEGVDHKFDDYLPNTPEERKLVDAYHAAEKANPIVPLPEYCTETRSVYDESPLDTPNLVFIDEEVGKECGEVKGKVSSLFRSHEDADDIRRPRKTPGR